MPEFLVFTLAAPMGSFGTVAGNERRTTDRRPGHSLIAGLLGAALGLSRDDPRLASLSEALRIGIDLRGAGPLLRDFHTIGSVKSRRNARHAIRRRALLDGDEYTTISQRDYLSDVICFVGLTLERDAFTLANLADALERPRFTLYCGRKSCPLSLPPAPLLITADSMTAALRRYAESEAGRNARSFTTAGPERLALDSRIAPAVQALRERRRTRPMDRHIWSFGLLEEMVLGAEREKPQ